ncbi:hypothetical protein ASZ90_013419 [hydrocarbon metagenome]|jgi:hypothetical protein|uniref:Uncharacterized protein n=1 Tax=hydrocarbon metagenome TaxID=938273 RepID=A0A0W8F801_9ZZZZ
MIAGKVGWIINFVESAEHRGSGIKTVIREKGIDPFRERI